MLHEKTYRTIDMFHFLSQQCAYLRQVAEIRARELAEELIITQGQLSATLTSGATAQLAARLAEEQSSRDATALARLREIVHRHSEWVGKMEGVWGEATRGLSGLNLRLHFAGATV
jgi:hypothetical protein